MGNNTYNRVTGNTCHTNASCEHIDISVVVPLFNEEESLAELYSWISRVCRENSLSYEVIFVNDGSTDHSWDVIERIANEHSEVHGIKFRRNYGKSPALYCGFDKAAGDVVITMDADLQDSPDEIPELYKMIVEEGYDLVSGYKMNRSQEILSLRQYRQNYSTPQHARFQEYTISMISTAVSRLIAQM